MGDEKEGLTVFNLPRGGRVHACVRACVRECVGGRGPRVIQLVLRRSSWCSSPYERRPLPKGTLLPRGTRTSPPSSHSALHSCLPRVVGCQVISDRGRRSLESAVLNSISLRQRRRSVCRVKGHRGTLLAPFFCSVLLSQRRGHSATDGLLWHFTDTSASFLLLCRRLRAS